MMRSLTLWCAVVALASGCGDDATSAPTGSNPCGACPAEHYCSYGRCIEDPGLNAGEAAECDYYGFSSTFDAAFARQAGGAVRTRFVTSNAPTEPPYDRPFDKLVFEIVHDRFFTEGPPGPGTFPLTGTEAVGSPLFLRGHAFCNDYDCANTFIVERGELELSEPGLPGGRLEAVLRDLRLVQVRIDPQTGAIIPFNKGKVWCMGDHRVASDVPALSTAEGTCVAGGTGQNIGDNIRDFTLVNCYGEEVDVHERCGSSKALWIVASAGWCGACESFVPLAGERFAELADEGLDLMVVIGEDQLGGPPSVAYCLDYALAKGVDPAHVFIDNDGGRSWAATFAAINTYGGGSIALPWNAVLDGESFEYLWSSNAGSGDLYSVQDALLED